MGLRFLNPHLELDLDDNIDDKNDYNTNLVILLMIKARIVHNDN